MNCPQADEILAALEVLGDKNMESIFKINPTIVPKGWGKEIIFTTEAPTTQKGRFAIGYTGKILSFEKVGAEGSMHFHAFKHETFYIHSGRFLFKYILTRNAEEQEWELVKGNVVVIPPNNPHKIVCLEVGEIFESSTADWASDSYRVQKGDSQKPKDVLEKLI
jgi:mannose-6-phosphate isomerase-like protein (cupin superfamily)